jgi:hypothetical protein
MNIQEQTLGEVCNYAAGAIADDWEILIEITAGCASVRLYDQSGSEVQLCCDDSLEDQVKHAVSYSREHDDQA